MKSEVVIASIRGNSLYNVWVVVYDEAKLAVQKHRVYSNKTWKQAVHLSKFAEKRVGVKV